MAKFCGSCGAPAAGAFCGTCGKPVAGAAAAPAPQPSAPAPVKGSSATKVILVLGGIFLLIAGAVVGGVIYVGLRVKQKVAEVKQEMGISQPAAERRELPPPSGSGCTLLSGEEAGRVLDIAFERVDTRPASDDGVVECEFVANKSERRRLAAEQMRSAMKGLGAGGGEQKDAEKLITGAMNALEGADGGGDPPGFELKFTPSGGKERLAEMKALPGFEALSGVGDQAVMAAHGLGVFFVRGEALYELNFKGFAPGPEKATALAQRIKQP